MINYQSPYGQIIKIPSERYYDMSDEELKLMEEKYACSNKPVINFSNSSGIEDEYLIDDAPILFDFSGEQEE